MRWSSDHEDRDLRLQWWGRRDACPTAGKTPALRDSLATALKCSAGAAVLTLLSGLLLFSAADERRIAIYSAAANYSLSVLERDGRDYIGVLEVLEPLGSVGAKSEGTRWRLRYNSVESEFNAGQTRARIAGADLDLPAKFLLENGRGLVPLSSLSTLLPRFLGGPVTFHESSRRLFIGNVAVHFTAQVNKANPPSLVMEFTSPVNPMIATEPGKLRMVFSHEPLVPPGSQTLTFDSKTIPSASYREDNGTAEISIAGSVPLFASFGNDGRTITITPAPQAGTPLPAQPLGVPAGNSITAVQVTPGIVAPAISPNGPVAYFAVVDASHGGDERGAALSDQLAEKDVTLSLARRLKQELESHSISALLLRDGDTTLSLEQRAILVNKSNAVIYVCLHATSLGNGVRLYTVLLPSGEEDRGVFLDWDTAQYAFLTASQTAGTSLAAELQKSQIPVRTLIAPLRPLNNITAAAVAVEVAPPAAGGVPELNSPEYQHLVASSVAAGIVDVRDKLGVGR